MELSVLAFLHALDLPRGQWSSFVAGGTGPAELSWLCATGPVELSALALLRALEQADGLMTMCNNNDVS